MENKKKLSLNKIYFLIKKASYLDKKIVFVLDKDIKNLFFWVEGVLRLGQTFIINNTKFKNNFKVLDKTSLDKNVGLIVFINIKQQDVFFKKLEHLPHLNIMSNVSKKSDGEVFISNKKSSSKIFFEDFSNSNVSFLIDLIETAFIDGIGNKWQK